MKSYSPDGTPEFADSIQICETTDKGHADNINAAPKQLLENDLALKDEMDRNFLKKEDVANNLVTTNGGWVLDARQGKVLKDEINQRLSFEKKNTNIGNTFDISRYMVDNWAMLVIGRVTSAVPDSGFIFFVSGVEKSFVHVAPIHAAGNCASVAVSNGILTIKYMTGDGNAFIIPFNQ